MYFLEKEEDDNIKVVTPNNLGWLEKKLSKEEMDYLWDCINNRQQESAKQTLAGNIHESNFIDDESDWFFTNTLFPLCQRYGEEFGDIGIDYGSIQHPYHLRSFWVNFQKQHEFNPLHAHVGVYSFVVWMKIPTKHDEQIENPISKSSGTPLSSCFQFQYLNMLGEMCSHTYKMNPRKEGTLLFFPASLNHCVHPFYNCDEDRISVSGNIAVDTSRVFEQ